MLRYLDSSNNRMPLPPITLKELGKEVMLLESTKIWSYREVSFQQELEKPQDTAWVNQGQSILGNLGCYNRISSSGQLIKNRNVLIVLEAGKSNIKVLTALVSGEDLLPGSQMAIVLLCLYMVEEVRELSGVCFIRALISFRRAPSSGPNNFPKSPTST